MGEESPGLDVRVLRSRAGEMRLGAVTTGGEVDETERMRGWGGFGARGSAVLEEGGAVARLDRRRNVVAGGGVRGGHGGLGRWWAVLEAERSG